MKRQRAMTVFVAIVAVSVALIGYQVWLKRPQPANTTSPEPAGHSSAELWTPTDFGRTKYVESSPLTQLGESGNSSYSPTNKHWTFGIDQDTPKELPKVKFVFLNGGKPQLVHSLSFRDLRRNGASRISGRYYCSGVSFYKAGPPPIHGGFSCTLPLCDEATLRMGDNLYLGRTYFVGVKLPEPNRFGSECGCMIVSIPRTIPDGESFLVEVDVRKLITGEQLQNALNGMKKLRIRIETSDSKGLVVRYFDPIRDGDYDVFVFSPLNTTLHIFNLGGELSVLRDKDGFVTYHIAKVDNLEIKLPRDAEWSASVDNTIEFALDLPIERMPVQAMREICLSLTKEGRFVAWGSPLTRGENGGMTLKKQVKLRCKPGLYFVKYRIKGRKRATECLGRIEVGKNGNATWLEGTP